MSTITLQISPYYGYVVIVVILSWVLINWLSLQVTLARKRYNVQYPDMYSPHSSIFNCIQRAHQNTLEGFPIFLVMLLLGGLRYPIICSVSGVVWVISRVTYARGYYTGDPAKRRRGVYGYVSLLVLLVCTGMFALELIGLI